MARRCEGKLALVTGGAQGLGAAHSRRLAQEGAKVLLTDINEQGARDVAFAINSELGREVAFSLEHDVTKRTDWDAAIETANKKLGGLNVLVNNAGIGVAGNIETCKFEDWQRCFAINVNGIFHGCQTALPLMRDNAPGSIINISSIAGLIASDTMPAYNASKAKGKRFLKANTKTKKDGTREAGKELTGEQVLDILINRAKRVAGEEDKS